MNRVALVDKLSLVAPALAKTAFMPILNDIWFTGAHAKAFNEQIGVAVPLKTDFKGSVGGELLLGLLRNSRAKEAIMTPGGKDGENDQHLALVASSTKAKLGLQPESAFEGLWDTPKPNTAKQILLKTEKQVSDLLAAIDLVMISVSSDTTIPDQMGVTFIPEDGGVGLFSTNHHSMSYNYVKLPKTWPHRVILPALFCQQLRSLGGKRKEIALEVYKDHVLALISDVEDKEPPIILFGGVLESERPHNFGKNLDHHFTAKARKMLVPIPAALKGIAERAFLVSQDKKEKKPTTLTVREGILHSYTDGLGEVRDRIKLEDHADAELPINVSLLRIALASYYSSIDTENGKFCVTPECLIMTQGEGVYLLSEWQKEKGK